MAKQKKINHILHEIQSIFLTGLFALLPIILTIALFKFAFHLLKTWLEPLYIHKPLYGNQIPHSEILVVVIVIFLAGALIKYFVFDNLLHKIESSILKKIPLLGHVYFGIKQLVSAFNTQQSKTTFKHVVLVEFPRAGAYSIGFLTNDVPPALAPHTLQKFVGIFIPTTPNPTTGFYITVPEDSYKILEVTRQEAMTIIISGGIIQPDKFNI